MPPARKPFLLRIPPELLEELRRWAGDEMRSLNGQIEFLLRDALRRQGRRIPKASEDAPNEGTPSEDAPGEDGPDDCPSGTRPVSEGGSFVGCEDIHFTPGWPIHFQVMATVKF